MNTETRILTKIIFKMFRFTLLVPKQTFHYSRHITQKCVSN